MVTWHYTLMRLIAIIEPGQHLLPHIIQESILHRHGHTIQVMNNNNNLMIERRNIPPSTPATTFTRR